MTLLPILALGAIAFALTRQRSGLATPPKPPPPPSGPPAMALSIFQEPIPDPLHYLYVWVLVRGCQWQPVKDGWGLDGLAELTAAHVNAPTFYWMWDLTKYREGQNPWTSGMVDRFRAASIGCCKEIGGC